MVSTLKMKRVGYMHTDCIVPLVGNNPYATSAEAAEELHTAAEGSANFKEEILKYSVVADCV